MRRGNLHCCGADPESWPPHKIALPKILYLRRTAPRCARVQDDGWGGRMTDAASRTTGLGGSPCIPIENKNSPDRSVRMRLPTRHSGCDAAIFIAAALIRNLGHRQDQRLRSCICIAPSTTLRRVQDDGWEARKMAGGSAHASQAVGDCRAV